MSIEDQPHRKVYELVSIGGLVKGRRSKGSPEDNQGYALRRKSADKHLQLLRQPDLVKNKGNGLHRGRHIGLCVLSENTILCSIQYLYSTNFLKKIYFTEGTRVGI
jgi:hypothetical protein